MYNSIYQLSATKETKMDRKKVMESMQTIAGLTVRQAVVLLDEYEAINAVRVSDSGIVQFVSAAFMTRAVMLRYLGMNITIHCRPTKPLVVAS